MMGTEIERKFLVKPDSNAWREGSCVSIRQGYLSRNPAAATVRVRRIGNKGFLTIKGPATGPTCAEFEYEIPASEADALLGLCEGSIIEKTRHALTVAGNVWVVDEFAGDNAGLRVAEIELQAEDQPFDKPDWVTLEVTGESKYYNASLASDPYRDWE
jgi:adenylate cyclase